MNDIRILFLIAFPYEAHRLGGLLEQLASAAGWGAQKIDCIILTETDNPQHLAILHRLADKFQSHRMHVTISPQPETASQLSLLPWQHRKILSAIFPDNEPDYTYCLCSEAGLNITEGTLRYFMTNKPLLAPYGLLPSFVRYEFNLQEGDVFTLDQQGQQDLLHKNRVMAGGHEWLCLEVPYPGMFMLDEQDIAEYLASPSSDPYASSAIVGWGKAERAFMGLVWEKIPDSFTSRSVIPLKPGANMPDPSCWVHHLADNYTNDYTDGPNYILGKTRMDSVFIEDDAIFAGWRYASCLAQKPYDNSITVLARLYQAETYNRPLPPLVGQEGFVAALTDSNTCINQMPAHVLASHITVIQDAFLLGSVLYAPVNGMMSIILETYRANDRPFVRALPPEELSGQEIHHKTIPLGHVSFFLGSAGSFNYGHWLTDDLPRLESVLLLHNQNPDRPIRILLDSFSPRLNSIKEESIRLYLGFISNISITFLDPDSCYNIPELHYTTPVSYHPTIKSPQAIETAYRRIVKSRPLVANRRLFVSRRPPDTRALTNHDEIETLLAAYGFETFVIEEQSFQQQVEYFANAEIIIGCMGASMTNMMFAPQETTVIMLAPEGWIEPYYWDLASVKKLHYTALYGPLDNPSSSPITGSYTIPPNLLEQILQPILQQH